MRKKAKYKEWYEKGVRASKTGELEYRVRTELWDLIHHITVKIIIDKLALKGNETVFDVGCGWSRVILGIKKYFPEMNIHGIELSEAIYKKGVELAEQLGFDKISIQNGDVLKIDLPEEKYDAIYSTRVIHYLEDEEKQIAIQKIYSMLKFGGKVLIIIPNSYCPYRFSTYKHAPLYPIKRICLALEKNKFRNVTWGSYGFIPPWKRFTWDNQFMKLELLLEKIPFVNLIGGLVYTMQKSDLIKLSKKLLEKNDLKYKDLKITNLKHGIVYVYSDKTIPDFVIKKTYNGTVLLDFLTLLKQKKLDAHFVKVIDVDEENHFYLMSFQEGVSLKKVYFLSLIFPWNITETARNFRFSANLLAEFHIKTLKEYKYIRDLIDLDELQPHFDEKSHLKDEFLKVYDSVKNVKIPICKIHNDNSLRNYIICNKSRVPLLLDLDACIHPDLFYFGPAVIDYLCFKTNMISYMKFSPLISKKTLKVCLETFELTYRNQTNFYLYKNFDKICYIFFVLNHLGIQPFIEDPLQIIYDRGVLAGRVRRIFDYWLYNPKELFNINFRVSL